MTPTYCAGLWVNTEKCLVSRSPRKRRGGCGAAIERRAAESLKCSSRAERFGGRGMDASCVEYDDQSALLNDGSHGRT